MSGAVWPRPLPPYGRELLDARRAGQRPVHPVFVVDSWAQARYLRECWDFYAIPVLGHGPVELGFLRGLEVVLVFSTWDVLGLAMRIAEAEPAAFYAMRFEDWRDLTLGCIEQRAAA
jgi:hypothetical protein